MTKGIAITRCAVLTNAGRWSSPIPRSNRFLFRPQSETRGPGLLLQQCIGCIAGIFFEMPGQPRAYQRLVEILIPVIQDDSNQAAVPVRLSGVQHCYQLSKTSTGGKLPRFVCVGLLLFYFRTINMGEPDHQWLALVQYLYRIPIFYPNHFRLKGSGDGCHLRKAWKCNSQQQDNKKFCAHTGQMYPVYKWFQRLFQMNVLCCLPRTRFSKKASE